MDAEHEVVAEVLATDNRGERERVACSYSCEWYTSVLLFSLVLRSLEVLYSTLRTNKVTDHLETKCFTSQNWKLDTPWRAVCVLT